MMDKSDLDKREQVLKRWNMLKNERSSWDSHWREISDYLLPRSGRFFTSDRNRGERKHNNIYDSTGTRSLRVLAAGMMAGMTSPARPWFRLTTSDPELDESSAVKSWLADVQRLMLMVFTKSNTYRALHSLYEELGAFGTAASIIVPNFDTVLHHHPLTVGEYAISTNDMGVVDTLYREFDMTVAQVVAQFGLGNCSQSVRNMYERNNMDTWVTVVHAIEPRKQRDANKRDAKNMAFRSCYIEKGSTEKSYLRESGFKEFRAVAPRWATSGGDIYGNSPGMECLGDIKQLQHEQLRKAECIDYQTKPPLQVPTSLKEQPLQRLPGGITYVDSPGPGGGVKSMFEVNLRLDYLLEDIRDVRERIRGSFYADLFLMLSQNPVGNMTATEVAERHEEKLLMLGPVLERLHNELLSPLIEMTFSQIVEAGILPPPPEELQDMELSVEFVSMLAQAQRAVATNGIDRYVANLGQVATIKPEVLDKFDSDRWADEYADILGVNPELIVPGEKVALIRKQRAEAMQAQAQQEQMAQSAQTARDLAQAQTGTPSALTNVMDMFSGYNT
jgi:hypothetical protein